MHSLPSVHEASSLNWPCGDVTPKWQPKLDSHRKIQKQARFLTGRKLKHVDMPVNAQPWDLLIRVSSSQAVLLDNIQDGPNKDSCNLDAFYISALRTWGRETVHFGELNSRYLQYLFA